MFLSQPDYQPSLALQQLAFNTYSLTERLALSNIPIQDLNQDLGDIARQRLQTWQKIAAKNDLIKFSHRLLWSGLNQDRVLAALAGGEPTEQCKVPISDWLICLQSVLNIANNYSPKSSPKTLQNQCFKSESPIPFESVYVPFLAVAENNLQFLNCLAPEAKNHLLRSLLENLAKIGTPTLMGEFETFRGNNNSLRDFLLMHITHKQRQKFQSFLELLFEDGLWGLFQKYPVLAKLLSLAVIFWCKSISEFQSRLEQDWKEIEKCFSPHQSLTQVVDCQCNLSDSHNGGRSVLIITFDTGLKIVYKPRNLAIDCAFNKILDWCNQQPSLLHLLPITILNREDYGWMEFIPNRPCKDNSSIERFYERCGMLLALLYLLEGTDCHQENLIASGEYPVFIDGETLFHHHIKTRSKTDHTALENASQILQDSVLRTFLLPQWGILPNDTLTVDISGLGGETQSYETPVWKHINTDGMRLETAQTKVVQENAPTLLGKTIDMSSYQLEVTKGFQKMYLVLLNQKEFLLSKDSHLQAFAQIKVRFVFRNTQTYYAILQNSYNPKYMKNGVDRSIALESLSRAFLTSDERPIYWSILEAEIQSLEQMDIPFFSTVTNDTHIYSPNGITDTGTFSQSSFLTVQNNIELLSKEKLQTQLVIIEGALQARYRQEPSLPTTPILLEAQNTDYAKINRNKALLETAIILGETLISKGITGSDSGLAWFGLTYKPTISRFRWQVLGVGFWDGNIGIALFFASLAKITGESQWYEYTQQVLSPLQETFSSLNSLQQRRFGTDIGIANLGSMIYGLETISKLLGSQNFASTSQKILECITPELIKGDIYFTVLNGSAGGILGLLALSECSPLALELARKCGNHLVGQKGDGDKTPKPIGFSSGMAGIAYSLLQLYKATGDEIYMETAKAAITYERLSFDRQSGIWNDFRTNPPRNSMSWANGATGIGLARLGGLSELDTPDIREEIDHVLQAIKQYSIWGEDDLMWGNCGRIETLLFAANTLNDPDLLALAKSWGHTIQESHQLLVQHENLSINPSLLHGISGIGYTILRLIHPDLLPCILLLQSGSAL
ncbi:type 2 lanthipeptide synthetase LanM family protein [Pseudanabaena sp. BC1403]|uniref:type 2 lanthipeptide synthetase LanM family protein n=1 Tax=Pseudanabaena sp. BC1403 TaxID=2043171 RepID=UPI000CD921A6|nr:type 2 lanthipeptide synthetase LanM family protein [Pseudanabaena sp. BC1403]